MRWSFTHSARSSLGPDNQLQRYAGQPCPTADLVLLCCFGLELTGERSYEQLRQALHDAGFSGLLARHIITVSRCVHRTANGRYRLREPER